MIRQEIKGSPGVLHIFERDFLRCGGGRARGYGGSAQGLSLFLFAQARKSSMVLAQE